MLAAAGVRPRCCTSLAADAQLASVDACETDLLPCLARRLRRLCFCDFDRLPLDALPIHRLS